MYYISCMYMCRLRVSCIESIKQSYCSKVLWDNIIIIKMVSGSDEPLSVEPMRRIIQCNLISN